MTDSISSQKKSSGKGILIFMGVLFLLIGVIVTYIFGVRPVMKVMDAESWVETPCAIVSSKVESHRSDNGYTYSIAIVYTYTHKGIAYSGKRYDFFSFGSSSGTSGKREIVNQYPKGSTKKCFVDPDDPGESVLNRSFSLWFLLGFIPLVFAFAGLAMLIGASRMGKKLDAAGEVVPAWKPDQQTQVLSSVEHDGRTIYRAGAGSITLKSKSSPLGMFIFIVIFGAIWNGIVGVFVYNLFSEGGKNFEWFTALFMIPFVLIGLGVIVGAVFQFLKLFNPKPEMVVSTDAVPLGGSVAISWKVPAGTFMPKNLHIYITAKEEARYRRGTTTVTSHSEFHRSDVVNTAEPVDINQGQGLFTIPADSMHSFEADNNKIIWELNLHGDISRWPDIKETFPIVVLPAEGPS